MTMTETPATAPAATPAKPKRKPQRKTQVRRAPIAAAVAEPGSKLAGITPRDCPIACKASSCVISECNRCAHPLKGGLPAGMQTTVTLRNINEARRILGKQKLDLTTP